MLLEFYNFPAEPWKHLRTTNPIESTFATVRHRTIRSKGSAQQDRARNGFSNCPRLLRKVATAQRTQPIAKTRSQGDIGFGVMPN